MDALGQRERGARLLARAGVVPMLERIAARQRNVLRILAYHRVDHARAAPTLDPSLLSATPESFAQQMRFLVDHYHVISLEELLSSLKSQRPLPPRSVLVTFDDGYRDFLEHAWPVLHALQVPAVLFVATGYLTEETRWFWWDRLYHAFCTTRLDRLTLPYLGSWSWSNDAERHEAFEHVKQIVRRMENEHAMALVARVGEALQVTPPRERLALTWQELKQLSVEGLYVGAHTRSHPLLSRISTDEAMQEIVGSREDIERELGRAWPIFAYPSGHPADLDPALYSLLAEAGFQLAFTMIEGHNVMGHTHPLKLKRVGMAASLSLAEFRLALTGVYDLYGVLLKLRTGQSAPLRTIPTRVGNQEA